MLTSLYPRQCNLTIRHNKNLSKLRKLNFRTEKDIFQVLLFNFKKLHDLRHFSSHFYVSYGLLKPKLYLRPHELADVLCIVFTIAA